MKRVVFICTWYLVSNAIIFVAWFWLVKYLDLASWLILGVEYALVESGARFMIKSEINRQQLTGSVLRRFNRNWSTFTSTVFVTFTCAVVLSIADTLFAILYSILIILFLVVSSIIDIVRDRAKDQQDQI